MFIQPDQFALPCWNTRRMRSVAQFVFAVILLTGGAATAFLFRATQPPPTPHPPRFPKKYRRFSKRRTMRSRPNNTMCAQETG